MRGATVLRYERRERRAAEELARASGAGLRASDVGRALRNERVRQGLSHRDVSRRLGIPEDQLRAAESGALRRTDQLSALKTVRRYADMLGLPGDRYALAILEQWPTSGPAPGPDVTAAHELHGPPTRVTPAVGRVAAETAPARDAAFLTSAFTPIDPDFVVFDEAYRPDPTAAGGAYTGDATGIVPAVPIATTGGVVRRNPMPFPVRAAAAVLALAVVAAGAVLAVDQLHPAWLRSVGLGRAAMPGATAARVHSQASTSRSTGVTASGARTGANPGGTPAAAPGASSGPVVADALRPRSTSGSAASVDAGAAPAHLRVSAVGGPCWVQVTAPTSASPLFSGVLTAGEHRAFTLRHGASVELGSTAGRVSVASHSGQLSTYRPPAAPFTLSVHNS